MYKKNPYQNHIQDLQIDKTTQNIIKKAKKYNIVVFNNTHLREQLLDIKEQENDFTCKVCIDLFAWFLEQEKTTQLSKD